jgi:hypothetical protein
MSKYLELANRFLNEECAPVMRASALKSASLAVGSFARWLDAAQLLAEVDVEGYELLKAHHLAHHEGVSGDAT